MEVSSQGRRIHTQLTIGMTRSITTGVPQRAMYVMSNVWWPNWVRDGDNNLWPALTDGDRFHEIDRIIY